MIGLTVGAFVLGITNTISPGAQVTLNVAIVTWWLARSYSVWLEQRRATKLMAEHLSVIASQMSSVLASGELDEEDQVEVQQQRAQVMTLLGQLDRPKRLALGKGKADHHH